MKQWVLWGLLALGMTGCVTPGSTLSSTSNDSSSTAAKTTTTTSANAEMYFLANRDLLAAETKWRQKQPDHYTYTLQRSCFCTPEFRKPIAIEVEKTRLQKASYAPEGSLLPLERINDALTVDGLFEVVRSAIDSKAARIDVEYDSTYGYPTSISLDPNLSATDDEMYYTATELTTVTKPVVKKSSKKTTKKKTVKSAH